MRSKGGGGETIFHCLDLFLKRVKITLKNPQEEKLHSLTL